MIFSRACLRGHRNGRGLSLPEVGARVGLTAGEVDAFERGEQIPDDLTVDALAEALEVAPRALRSPSGNYTQDYVSAALSHAQPLQPEDIERAARALRR